jgi:hypothetical protein
MRAVERLTMGMRVRLFVQKLEVEWSTLKMRREPQFALELIVEQLIFIVG